MEKTPAENISQSNPEIVSPETRTNRYTGDKALLAYSLSEKNATSLEELDFSDIYSETELKKQADYVRGTEARIARGFETYNDKLAKSLESIFTQGVMRGHWLNPGEKFGVDAIESSKYDDYKHRVDVVVTMKLDDKDDIEELGSSELVFGVDVTTSGNKDTILDKFERADNDKEDSGLPSGFSSLSRYSNRREHRKLPLVPRYVIGMSSADVENFLATTPKDKRGDFIFRSDIQSDLTRFKILSEIRAQNWKYGEVLFSEDDDGADEKYEKAGVMIDIIDRVLNGALEETTKRLAESSLFAKDNLRQLSEKARREHIDALIRKRGQAVQNELRSSMIARGEDPSDNYCDTYTQIMDTAAELSSQ